MKIYRVKGNGSTMTYVRVIEELEDEVHLMVTRQVDGEQRISRDRISRDLFNTCLETGYLIETAAEESGREQKLSA